MKHLYKLSITVILFIFFVSCTNEIKSVATANGLVARKDQNTVNPPILTEASKADTFAEINWDPSDNGVASNPVYTIVINDKDVDPNFKDAVEYSGSGINVSETQRKAKLKIEDMNNLMLSLPSFKCSEMNIDIRIKSTLGLNPANAIIQYSNPLTYKITGFSKSIPILAFSKVNLDSNSGGKLQGTNYAVFSDFEGYTYLTAGNYKFYKPNGCGEFTSPTAFGSTSNSLVGTLSTTGNDIVIANSNYYLVTADLTANTYSIKEFRTFGVFGTATRVTAFANAVPMLDNNNNNIWTLTVELIKGKIFRFKSNLWTGTEINPPISNVNIGTVAIPILVPVQFPPFIPSTGTTQISILGKNAVSGQVEEVTGTNGEISVPGAFVDNSTRQKYDIVLDVSKPRNYTYTITPNNN